jgi:hypothetical protein
VSPDAGREDVSTRCATSSSQLLTGHQGQEDLIHFLKKQGQEESELHWQKGFE